MDRPQTRRLAVPALPPRLLVRERLLTRLRDGLHAPLTVVQAEFGFGKTTALAQFARQVHEAETADVAWYTIREKEAHLASFLDRFTQSIRQIYPAFGTRLILNLRECGDNEAEFRDHLVQVFLADLGELAAPCVFVLDDIHFVDTNEHVLFFLQHVVEDLPAHLHLYLGTRRGLPMNLDLLRMKNELVELRRKDLEFTPDEAQKFFAVAANRRLDRRETDALVKLTQGWAGAMVLFARKFTEDPDAVIEQFATLGVQPALHALIDEQIVQGLREEVTAVLIVANVLGTWDIETVAEIFAADVGRDEIERTVRGILQRNEFFLIQTTNVGGMTQYTFNPIFADYLWTKTQPRHLALVAEFYEQHDFLWRAIDHYVRARRWDDGVRTLEAAFINPPLNDAPTPHERLRILNQVPAEVQEKHDIFLLYHAFLLMQNQEFSQSLALTNTRTVGSKFDVSFRILELFNRLALLGPRDPVLAQQFELLQEDLDRINDAGFSNFNKLAFLSMYAVVLSMHNQGARALQYLGAAPFQPGQTPYIHARVHQWLGNLDTARDSYEQLRRDMSANTRPWELARDLTNATEIALGLGRPVEARAYNRQLKELAAKYFLRKDGMLADAWSVRIAVAAHDYRAAAAAPQELIEYFRTRFRPTTGDMIVFYRALALYALGDYTGAWRELLPEAFTHTYDLQRIALKMVLAQEMQLASYEKIFYEQTRALADDADTPPLLRGILHQYLAYDLYLKAAADPAHRAAFETEMRTLLAVPHVVDGNDTPFGMRLVLRAYAMLPALRQALHDKLLPETPAVARGARTLLPDLDEEQRRTIGSLLTALGVEEPRSVADDDAASVPAAPLAITCLGEYTVRIHGAPLAHKQWTAKNQELFLYFALHPNQDLGDHDVCHALWPAKTEDSARASLMNGIHTLKKIFADTLPDGAGVVFARNRSQMAYRLLLSGAVTLDGEEFARLRLAGDTAQAAAQPEQAAQYYLQALRRCAGDVAASGLLGRATADMGWLDTERRRVRGEYFEVLQTFVDIQDPGLFPVGAAETVLDTVVGFRDVRTEEAEILNAFVHRAMHCCVIRGEDPEADRIHARYDRLRETHVSLSTAP